MTNSKIYAKFECYLQNAFNIRESNTYVGNFGNAFPNNPWFLRVCSTILLKTLEKGEIARNE